MTLVGGAAALTGPAAFALISLDVEDARGRRVPPLDALPVPIGCAATCKVHYRIDLTLAARDSGDAYAVAARSGPDLLAPATTWLLRPEPVIPRLPVRIAVDPGAGVRFLAGFHQTGERDVYEIKAEDLPAAGYTAFGSFAELSVPVTEGRIDVAVLGGSRTATDAMLGRWVSTMAKAIEGLYGRFPVARAVLFLIPEEGVDGVSFGRTLPAGGASILLAFGARAGEKALHDDWILTHELVHLGVPSFFEEGRWLGEGLATYYEPVLRTRAGLRSDASLWAEFAAQMPRGLASPGEASLPRTKDHDRTYWGGATFALAADVLIRARTGGARSLDDGLRAVQGRGGDATQVWSVASFLRVVDEAVGVRATQDLYALAERSAGCPGQRWGLVCLPEASPELTGLFRALGVERLKRRGEIALHDDAPLARLRRKIAGSTH